MTEPAATKFYIKNLDCAACAAKIERGLNRLSGVGDATLDFANLVLFVKTDDAGRVIVKTRGGALPDGIREKDLQGEGDTGYTLYALRFGKSVRALIAKEI